MKKKNEKDVGHLNYFSTNFVEGETSQARKYKKFDTQRNRKRLISPLQWYTNWKDLGE